MDKRIRALRANIKCCFEAAMRSDNCTVETILQEIYVQFKVTPSFAMGAILDLPLERRKADKGRGNERE